MSWETSNLNDVYIPGEIKMYAGPIAPKGFLICDGTTISRTAYSKLFAVIGTSYGTGDGSTTFNLPNFKGKVAAGLDSTQTEFNTLGKTGGEKTHKLTIAEMPNHNHNYTGPTFDQNSASGSSTRANTANYTSSGTGGDQAHNNLQPYITVNYIIKY
jgi:microcystin-dependent protein